MKRVKADKKGILTIVETDEVENKTITLSAAELVAYISQQSITCATTVMNGKDAVNLESIAITITTDTETASVTAGSPERIITTCAKTLMQVVRRYTTCDREQFLAMLAIAWDLETEEECQRGNADTLH